MFSFHYFNWYFTRATHGLVDTGLASGPPPCSGITLQSGPRNPSQKNASCMSEITCRINVRTNSEYFGQCRESRCKLRRSVIKYKNCARAKSANLVARRNSILSRSLNHRQFQALTDEVNVQYGDLRSSLAESRSHAAPCAWPAEGDRNLSSSEESSLRWHYSTRDDSLA